MQRYSSRHGAAGTFGGVQDETFADDEARRKGENVNSAHYRSCRENLEREELSRAKRAREETEARHNTESGNTQDHPDAKDTQDHPDAKNTQDQPDADVHSGSGNNQNHPDGDAHNTASSGSGLSDADRRRQQAADADALQTTTRQRLADPRGEKRGFESAPLTMEQQHEAMMRRRLEHTRRGEKRELEDRGSEGAFKNTFVGELEVMQEDEELFQDFEPEDFAEGKFVDEFSGEELDPKKSVEARLEELTFINNISLYDEKDVE